MPSLTFADFLNRHRRHRRHRRRRPGGTLSDRRTSSCHYILMPLDQMDDHRDHLNIQGHLPRHSTVGPLSWPSACVLGFPEWRIGCTVLFDFATIMALGFLVSSLFVRAGCLARPVSASRYNERSPSRLSPGYLKLSEQAFGPNILPFFFATCMGERHRAPGSCTGASPPGGYLAFDSSVLKLATSCQSWPRVHMPVWAGREN